MITSTNQKDEVVQVKRFNIRYPIEEYTFPEEALINDVRFDEEFIHVDLTDRRVISIPLRWIPTVYHASMEDRRKFEINQSRTMIIWDPEKCGINDEISIADYLGPSRDEIRPVYFHQEPARQVAEAKAKYKKK
jgi:hypothetical protein